MLSMLVALPLVLAASVIRPGPAAPPAPAARVQPSAPATPGEPLLALETPQGPAAPLSRRVPSADRCTPDDVGQPARPAGGVSVTVPGAARAGAASRDGSRGPPSARAAH